MSDTELLRKSKPEPVRWLEVFTGTGRRRAWKALGLDLPPTLLARADGVIE